MGLYEQIDVSYILFAIILANTVNLVYIHIQLEKYESTFVLSEYRSYIRTRSIKKCKKKLKFNYIALLISGTILIIV